MKPSILFFITLLFAASVFGQEEEKAKRSFPFQEFTVSMNRTNVSSFGNENRFGCGAGMYYSHTPQKRLDLMLGIEYNYTSQFASIEYQVPVMTHKENVTFHIHDLSLPLFVRFNIGRNVKYFVESGFSFDFSLLARKNGYGIYSAGEEEMMTKFSLNAQGMVGVPHLGAFGGMGVRIPMKNIEWIVKADYKIGTRLLGRDDYKLHLQYYRLGVGIRKRK
jgi:hypothetical protein